jgi:DNA-directed RNA polymerase specialized sigma24 family protein
VPAGLDELAGGDDQMAALFNVVCAEFLGSLEPDLREVALLKLEGFTNGEIAARLGRVEKLAERRGHRFNAAQLLLNRGG